MTQSSEGLAEPGHGRSVQDPEPGLARSFVARDITPPMKTARLSAVLALTCMLTANCTCLHPSDKPPEDDPAVETGGVDADPDPAAEPGDGDPAPKV